MCFEKNKKNNFPIRIRSMSNLNKNQRIIRYNVMNRIIVIIHFCINIGPGQGRTHFKIFLKIQMKKNNQVT